MKEKREFSFKRVNRTWKKKEFFKDIISRKWVKRKWLFLKDNGIKRK